MNNEELQQELNLQFPSEIAGIKRPTEPVESKHDFFLKMPQLISKDPVLYNKMNLLFSILLSNDNALKQNIDTILGKLDNDYAQLDSPEFSGIPTVPTPEEQDKSEKIANTQWVQDYIDNFLVGNVIYRPFLQEGYVKLNGATVQREDYPKLVQYATKNSLFTADNSTTPWLFGNGDGETTFVLPDYRNVFIEGGDTPSKINAGLPNITGSVNVGTSDGQASTFGFTGALTKKGDYPALYGLQNCQQYSGEIKWTGGINIDASKSSFIYGSSTTVQPPAIVLIPQIKY